MKCLFQTDISYFRIYLYQQNSSNWGVLEQHGQIIFKKIWYKYEFYIFYVILQIQRNTDAIMWLQDVSLDWISHNIYSLNDC